MPKLTVRAALSQCSVWEAHGEKRFWKYCSHLPPSSCRQMVTISVRFLMCLLDQHQAREPSSGQRSRASDERGWQTDHPFREQILPAWQLS